MDMLMSKRSVIVKFVTIGTIIVSGKECWLFIGCIVDTLCHGSILMCIKMWQNI